MLAVAIPLLMDVLSYRLRAWVALLAKGRNPTSDGCALLFTLVSACLQGFSVAIPLLMDVLSYCHLVVYLIMQECRNPTSDGCALL